MAYNSLQYTSLTLFLIVFYFAFTLGFPTLVPWSDPSGVRLTERELLTACCRARRAASAGTGHWVTVRQDTAALAFGSRLRGC